MKKLFMQKKLSPNKRKLIEKCDAVCSSFARQGYTLTVRQLYYQLVTENVFPNSERSYKNLTVAVTDGRMLGMIDWNHITDLGRVPSVPTRWESPQQIMQAALNGYKENLWLSQGNYVEVMIEKQALQGVVHPVCYEHGVTFTSNKGYSSASAMYDAAMRMNAKIQAGKDVKLIYLGDHDPSGLDMSRDIEDRLETFLPGACSRQLITVNRIALNMSQVTAMELEPNPAKETDSRFEGYRSEYGDESWELDAIRPDVMSTLVSDAIISYIDDQDAWEEAEKVEEENKERIRSAIEAMSL